MIILNLWHISPKIIEKFCYDKIGSTEHCPQGWGFYLAEKESHAIRLRSRNNLNDVETYLHPVQLKVEDDELYDFSKWFKHQIEPLKTKLIILKNEIYNRNINSKTNSSEYEINSRLLHHLSSMIDNNFTPSSFEVDFPEDMSRKMYLEMGIKAISIHEQDSEQDGLTYICFDSKSLTIDKNNIRTFPPLNIQKTLPMQF